MTQFLPDELYVTNIPGDASEAEMTSLIETKGKVREYVVVSKRRDINITQAAIVRMEGHEAARQAKTLNRTEFKGKCLNIRWSHTQRVLWISYLHESVTNEMLQAAFSQFGPVSKALVVADAQTLATKCYGFVVFENKKDAAKALQRCTESPFLVGQSLKPAKAEWARLEDTDQGFSEEVKSGGKASKEYSAHAVAKFAQVGSREYLLAVRLAELEVEYQRMKKAMRSKMAELQDQLVMSGQSSTLATAIAADPVFAAVRAAGMPPPNSAMLMPQQVAVPPAMMPQQGQQQVFQQPMQTVHLGAPPPQQLYQQQYTAAPNPSAAYPSPGQYSAAPPPSGPFKREAEFHHVPPPKKADMRVKDLSFERFNPELAARAHHHPGGVAPQQQQQHSANTNSGLSFVKGGQLLTTDGSAELTNSSLASPQQPTASNAAASAARGSTDSQNGAAPLPGVPGAKPPGQSDFRGIGFSGPSGPTPPSGNQQQSVQSGSQAQQRYGAAPPQGPYPPPLSSHSQQFNPHFSSSAAAPSYTPAPQQAVSQYGQQQQPVAYSGQQQYFPSQQVQNLQYPPAAAPSPYAMTAQQMQYPSQQQYSTANSSLQPSQQQQQYVASAQQMQYYATPANSSATGAAAAPPPAMSGYGQQAAQGSALGSLQQYY
jgi:hypothetical protein